MPFAKKGGTAASLRRGSKAGSFAAAKRIYYSPSQSEVMEAVRSLYADGLEPFGRILLRRVREQCTGITAGQFPEDAPLVDPNCLHSVCRSCECLSMRPIDGNEISVRIVGAPACFVDISSHHDPYPPELWAAAALYFKSLGGENMLLPGGRYACAQELATRKLAFLTGRSLGEVCHIVQLAVSEKKILGYVDGNMVPYFCSEESVKEHCAVWQQPFCNPAKHQAPSWPAATWEQARNCLAAILRSASKPEPGMVTVSNVKRLFRSQFGLDLSETALGYSRLSELLQDAHFHDICRLQIRGAGQAVVCQVLQGASEAALRRAPARHAFAALSPPQSGAAGKDAWRADDAAARPARPRQQCLSTMPVQQLSSSPESQLEDFVQADNVWPNAWHHGAAGAGDALTEYTAPTTSWHAAGAAAPTTSWHAETNRGGSVAPPPGLAWPLHQDFASAENEDMLTKPTVPVQGGFVDGLSSQDMSTKPPVPVQGGFADGLSSQVQRLLELGRDERQATLRKLSGVTDGPLPVDVQASPCCRYRTISTGTATSSAQASTMELEPDASCRSMVESLSSGQADTDRFFFDTEEDSSHLPSFLATKFRGVARGSGPVAAKAQQVCSNDPQNNRFLCH